jgi:hypothetical protein
MEIYDFEKDTAVAKKAVLKL